MSLSVENAAVGGRLAGASCAIEPGLVTAICGPNGAGKSSLLGALAGLLQLDRGQASLDGQPLAATPLRDRARAIGYLPQSREIAWDMDVRTLAGLGRLPWQAGAAEDRRAVDAALTATDLAALAERPVSRLSGGEQARALLARVLAGEPRYVLADEPLAALDLAHQLGLLERFRKLAQAGVGVALVLHDLGAAMNAADRVVVLDRGRVVAEGAPREVLTAQRIRETWGVEAEWLEGPAGFALAASRRPA